MTGYIILCGILYIRYSICLSPKYQIPHYTEEELYFWLEQFKDGEIEDRHYQKTIISKFVHSVYVFDDKIKIAYNYCKDSTSQEIQLNDIISARYCPVSSSESASDEPCGMFEVCGDRSTIDTQADNLLCKLKHLHR